MAWKVISIPDADKEAVGTVTAEFRLDTTSESDPPDFSYSDRIDGASEDDIAAFVERAKVSMAQRNVLVEAGSRLASVVTDRLNSNEAEDVAAGVKKTKQAALDVVLVADPVAEPVDTPERKEAVK
jgi:hypothetical protein